MAISSPAAVVIRASEIPLPTAPASTPWLSDPNDRIMPVTVPVMPSSGERVATSTSRLSRFSSASTTCGA